MEEKKENEVVDKAVEATPVETEKETTNMELLYEIKALKREIWYNRIVLAIFFGIGLFYIHLQTSRLGDILGTFIQMFMQ